MKYIYAIWCLQYKDKKTNEEGRIWRPNPGLFQTQEEADFYCMSHNTKNLIHWWEKCELGKFTKKYMKEKK